MRKFSIFSTLILTIFGIILFCRGFLFMRKECAIKNSVLPSFESVYNRLILVVIDGLRYDYAEKYLTNLVAKESNSVMFKAISTPPTVTLQRLKSITTGSLPVFVEIGSNFQSTHTVVSDSFMSNFAKNGNITVLGDDTWVSLYDSLITNKITAPSFDIYDLNGVDNVIKENLGDVIEKNDSSLVVAHFLGVDHCGHVFNYKDHHVTDKIHELDAYINDAIIPKLNDDDLLVVMSDHGMTDSGAHGGNSKEETEAFIYAFNKNKLPTNGIKERKINQIDICPTISVLFKQPIPFLNVGTVISELIPPNILNESIHLNAEQITKLLNHESISFDTKIKDEEILKQGPALLDKKWSSFNVPLMVIGFILILMPIFLLPRPPLFAILHSFSLFSDSFIFGESLVVQFFCGLTNPSFIGRLIGFFGKCREDAHKRICLPTLRIPLFKKYKLTKLIGSNYIIPTALFALCLLIKGKGEQYMYFLAYHVFFSTGHQCSLSEINYDAAYAFGNYNEYLSPILVFINEFFPFIVTSLLCSNPVELVSCYSLSLACITCFCIYGRYHLMVWQVITPRFLFQCCQTLIVEIIVALRCIKAKKKDKTKLKIE